MKIGFTGTQIGMTDAQKSEVRNTLRDHCEEGFLEFHHGDCIGADAEACDIAHQEGYYIFCHPPSNPIKRAWKAFDKTYPERPYLERNHDIVDECDLLIATPKEFEMQLRSGTWATVRYANKRNKGVVIIYPDGAIINQ